MTDGVHTPLEFQPGISKNRTDFENEKRWVDGDKIRFQDGKPERIGGCIARSLQTPLSGVQRVGVHWNSLDGRSLLAFGSESDFVVVNGAVVTSILPVIETVDFDTPGVVDIDSVAGQNQVRVQLNSAPSGLAWDENSTAAFSGDVTFPTDGKTISASDRLTVATIHSQTDITFNVPSGSAFTVTENPSAIPTNFQKLLSTGQQKNIAAFGYGSGTYGSGPYGGPSSTSGVGIEVNMRQWSAENFGEDLIFNPEGFGIFYWDLNFSTYTRPTVLANSPAKCNTVFVAEPSPHVVALGCTEIGSSTFDPMLCRWSADDDSTDWTPTTTNTAGDYRFHGGSELIGFEKTRREILIWSDTNLFSMTPDPTDAIFSFASIGENCGLISKHASVEVDGVVYWLGRSNFFEYQGDIERFRTSIDDMFFDARNPNSLNYSQKEKVYAGVNREFNEVWWLYPSRDSDECDRYVIYNYKERHWNTGTWDRTVWIGDTDFRNPLAVDTNSVVLDHETGYSDNGTFLDSFVLSGDFDIEEGTKVLYISEYIPDFELDGTLDITFTAKKFPGETALQTRGPFTITQSTRKIHPRLRGRTANIKYSNNTDDEFWKEGRNRVKIRTDGER